MATTQHSSYTALQLRNRKSTHIVTVCFAPKPCTYSESQAKFFENIICLITMPVVHMVDQLIIGYVYHLENDLKATFHHSSQHFEYFCFRLVVCFVLTLRHLHFI